MLIATEPAMPTSPPPAPLVAFAPNSCCEFIVALTVTPFALIVPSTG